MGCHNEPPLSGLSTGPGFVWQPSGVNFLVTGGAGFIGSHVCERLLHSGHAVWAFDDLNTFYDPRPKQRNLRDLQLK
jgi:hypothetical protein